MQQIRVRTERRTQLVEITRDVQAALDGANGASAALVVYLIVVSPLVRELMRTRVPAPPHVDLAVAQGSS